MLWTRNVILQKQIQLTRTYLNATDVTKIEWMTSIVKETQILKVYLSWHLNLSVNIVTEKKTYGKHKLYNVCNNFWSVMIRFLRQYFLFPNIKDQCNIFQEEFKIQNTNLNKIQFSLNINYELKYTVLIQLLCMVHTLQKSSKHSKIGWTFVNWFFIQSWFICELVFSLLELKEHYK
jgi:hypothetical protein